MAALGTRLLTITVGGTDYTAQVSKVELGSAETASDFVTFADAGAGGGRDYSFDFTAVQDTATGTLWDKVFTAPGTTVACVLKPQGNTTPTVAQPHFTFNAVVSEPDGKMLGGEANSSTSARFTFECSWALTAKYVRVTA